MKKVIVGIFAHPDDEAFGPSGTIAKLSQKNNFYLICATKGEQGQDATSKLGQSLSLKRAQELKASAKILGIKKVYFLGFKDGTLSNNLYHKLAEKMQKVLDQLKPETIITVEPLGVSGHIDHITVSMVTNYLFERLPYVKTLMMSGQTRERAKMMAGKYFIYFPPGYPRNQFQKIVDIEDVYQLKQKAMFAHKSQIADAKRIIDSMEKLPKEEYFLVRKK